MQLVAKWVLLASLSRMRGLGINELLIRYLNFCKSVFSFCLINVLFFLGGFAQEPLCRSSWPNWHFSFSFAPSSWQSSSSPLPVGRSQTRLPSTALQWPSLLYPNLLLRSWPLLWPWARNVWPKRMLLYGNLMHWRTWEVWRISAVIKQEHLH